MSHSTAGKRARQIEKLRAQFGQADDLAFAKVLPAERIEKALKEEGVIWRERVYTPLVTLWAFLGQMISPDGSCRAAVARVLAWLVSCGEKPCTPQTGPYCKARQRLPESLFVRLARETGRTLHDEVPEEWRWKGRRVKNVDGTTVSMPDTPENQAEYPQPTAQKPGLGFPLVRMVVVFCLACGTALDAALGQYAGKQTGENSLLRSLEKAFTPGDVLLADRCFSGYFDIAWWWQRGVDLVVRLHQRRRCDWRRGRRLGPNDHVVLWTKPSKRPQWMDEATYEQMPATLELREVRVRIAEVGFRTREMVIVTTLLDASSYTVQDLADLYRARWHAELDLRSLKVTLGMDVLRCHTPEMVRKEIWGHLLVYNLIRTLMAQAADDNLCEPRDLSFKGTLQTLHAFADRLDMARGQAREELYAWLLAAIGSHRVGDRPNRIEPRARKRRPKSYRLLTKPRNIARKQMVA
jgi:DDE family transposase